MSDSYVSNPLVDDVPSAGQILDQKYTDPEERLKAGREDIYISNPLMDDDDFTDVEEEEPSVAVSNPLMEDVNGPTEQDAFQQQKEDMLNDMPDDTPVEPKAPEGYTIQTPDTVSDEQFGQFIARVPTVMPEGEGGFAETLRQEAGGEINSIEEYKRVFMQYSAENDALTEQIKTATSDDEKYKLLDERLMLSREAEMVAAEFKESPRNPNIRYVVPDKEISGRTKLIRLNDLGEEITIMKVVDAEKYDVSFDTGLNRVAEWRGKVFTENNPYNFVNDVQELINANVTDKGIVGSLNNVVTKPVLTAANLIGVGTVSGFLTAGDLVVYAVQDAFEETALALGVPYSKAKQIAEKPREAVGSMIEFAEITPLLGRPISSIAIAARMAERKALRKAIAQNNRVMREEEKIFNIYNIRSATENSRRARAAEAAKVVEDNKEVAVQIARDLQESMGVDNFVVRRRIRAGSTDDGKPIYRKDSKGEDVYEESVDYDAISQAGQDELEKLARAADEAAIAEGKTVGVAGEQRSTLSVDELLAMENVDNVRQEFLRTALNIDLLKKYTAVAADLKATHPIPKGQKINEWLFNTMSKAEDIDDPAIRALVDSVNKYGVDFPVFAAMVYANQSLAGKTLQTISRFNSKVLSKADEAHELQKAMYAQEGAFLKGVRRLENIRRGLMVAAFKTASRNAQSGLLRSGFQGMSNVAQGAIIEIGKGRPIKALRELKPISWDKGNKVSLPKNRLGERLEIPMPVIMSEEWSRSFGAARLIFDRLDNPEHVQGFAQLLLGQSKYKTMNERFYRNYNEIQQNIDVPVPTTRVGKLANAILDEGEDLTWTLNAPNRWQEFILRETHFTAEMIRISKQEWDIDLVDELLKGRLDDLLNDASDLRGNSKFKFYDIMDESTNAALRATYAAEPETAIGAAVNTIITKFGFTAVTPFPRFMITSMELIGNMVAGAPIVGARALLSGTQSIPPRLASRMIATNLAGLASITTAWQFLNSEFAGAVYDEAIIAGQKVNLGPLYFLPQMLLIAKAAKSVAEGEPIYITKRDVLQTLTGSGFRPGQTIDAITKTLIDVVSDEGLDWDRAGGYVLGQFIGELGASFLQPLTMAVDLSRAMQADPDLAYKDWKPDPNYDFFDAFSKGFSKPFKVKGFGFVDQKHLKNTVEILIEKAFDTKSPEERKEIWNEIAELQTEREEDRVSPSRQEAAKRGSPLLNFLGIGTSETDTPEQFFLKKLGLEDYLIGGRTGVGSIDRQVNEYLNDYVPQLVRDIMEMEGMSTKKQRALMEVKLKQLKRGIQGAFIKTKPLISYYFKLRRYPKSVRDLAREIFTERNGIKSDLGNVEHLMELNLIASDWNKLGQ